MSADPELLRRYVDKRSEAAFAELVRRHLDLVYCAALRLVSGNTHLAKDVAQSVFTDLARKAPALTGRSTLAGWLHTSTRFAAAKVRRADSSRRQHEQEATTMNALLTNPDSAAEWERLRPMIDDVVHELNDHDREAVLLRFFEGRTFAEIGLTLQLSEDAARMRVDRALDKLRSALGHRGVKSTGAALSAAFATQVGATAPAGLASAITASVLVGTGGGLAVAGAGILMSKTAITSAVALAAIGATFFQWNRAQRAEAELAALTADRDEVRAKWDAAKQRAERTTRDVVALQIELDSLKAKQVAMLAEPRAVSPVSSTQDTPVLTQQRTMLRNLRSLAAARDQFLLENGQSPASLADLVGETKYVRRLNPVNGENYSGVSLIDGQPMTVIAANGVTVTYDPAGPNTTPVPPSIEEQNAAELIRRVRPTITRALNAFRAAHPGMIQPRGSEALIPYFATPQEGADYMEYVEMKSASNGN